MLIRMRKRLSTPSPRLRCRRLSTLVIVMTVSVLSTFGIVLQLALAPHHQQQLLAHTNFVSADTAPNATEKEEHTEKVESSTQWQVRLAGANEDSLLDVSDAKWQGVRGTSRKFFVYSAFLDNREAGERVVRVVGVAPTSKPDNVLCHLTFDKEALRRNVTTKASSVLVVEGKVHVIKEHWNLKYSAVFVLCPIRVDAKPLFVSIVRAGGGQDVHHLLSNRLAVLNPQSSPLDVESAKKANVSSLGICVKPLHFTFNKSLELLEFLQFNRLLGVQGFVFYRESASPEVDCLLAQAADVKVLDWSGLNVTSKVEIRTEGIFAALNDCLYREMYNFEHLLFIDIDEFVVPYTHASIPAMLESVRLRSLNRSQSFYKHQASPKRDPSLIASYLFLNVFFYRQFPDDQQSNSTLLTLRKTRRSAETFPPRHRSKYVVVSTLVKEVGNHFVWEYLRGVNVNVQSDVALLHHYRVCEFGGDKCIEAPSRQERRVSNLMARQLTDAVNLQWTTINITCTLSTGHQLLKEVINIHTLTDNALP